MIDSKESASDSTKDKNDPAYLKRREQVRKAQRTHRERKEAYTKSLENEVLQLRTNESKLLQETKSLYNEIARLKSILDQHGIPNGQEEGFTLPSQPSTDSSGLPSLSSVSVALNPYQQQQLHIHGSEANSGSEFYLSGSDTSQKDASAKRLKGLRHKLSNITGRNRSESESYGDSNDLSSLGTSAHETGAFLASTSKLNIRDMDQTNLGMEFVLTLESPCLHHTQGDPKAPHDPSGHALTASAPLLFQSPNQPVTTTASSSSQWETSNLGLEKLLSLSSNFELTDELTPVQAWHQIRSHPDFESVEIPTLRRFTRDLIKHVKCYGFGAVVETETFAQLYGNLYPGSDTFGFGFY